VSSRDFASSAGWVPLARHVIACRETRILRRIQAQRAAVEHRSQPLERTASWGPKRLADPREFQEHTCHIHGPIRAARSARIQSSTLRRRHFQETTASSACPHYRPEIQDWKTKPGRRSAPRRVAHPSVVAQAKNQARSGSRSNRPCGSSRRWAVHIHYKAVVIRGTGLCIPATLGGELEHCSVGKMIADLSAGTAAYIHGIG
jgi:hypothetical protein